MKQLTAPIKFFEPVPITDPWVIVEDSAWEEIRNKAYQAAKEKLYNSKHAMNAVQCMMKPSTSTTTGPKSIDEKCKYYTLCLIVIFKVKKIIENFS